MWVVQFSSTPRGWIILFYNRNWHTFDTISSIRRNVFEPWLVYNRDDNFIHCKICTKTKKSNGMSKESQGRNVQNPAPFSHAGLQKHQIVNSRQHAICPTHTHTLGPGTRSLLALSVPGLTAAFSRWITLFHT